MSFETDTIFNLLTEACLSADTIITPRIQTDMPQVSTDSDQLLQRADFDQSLHCLPLIQHILTLTTLWADSADDKLMIFFSYFS